MRRPIAATLRPARLSRRRLLECAGAAALVASAPRILRAQGPLELRFRTIPDPDGWHPSLRLKGDWLVFEITDGRLSGYGEASHSNDDEGCKREAVRLFVEHYAAFVPSLDNLARKEREIGALAPDLPTATALSGLNQALYDLLANREGVPVWRLFRDAAPFEGLPLYTTINRALTTRTAEEYETVVGELAALGFTTYKCAPFEAVDGRGDAVEQSRAGITRLTRLRERFPDLAVRVDFHERFAARSEDFMRMLPELERLQVDWIEEPFPLGAAYDELRRRTRLRVAAGELFWGHARFEEIATHAWADVIMPDVKHVGGFGPLLDVLQRSRGMIEVSPHNPSGPISTAASLHAAAVYPDVARSIEFSFDRRLSRRSTGERIEQGVLLLSDRPGFGVEPQAI
jgi:galactonate dehydratase